MLDVAPTIVESHPVAGALPPTVFNRWMKFTVENVPVPMCPVARSSSHGIAVGSGEGDEARRIAVTCELSVASQVGAPATAKWVPICAPAQSYRFAIAVTTVQPYAFPASAPHSAGAPTPPA